MINHADILKDELRKANLEVNKKYSTLKKVRQASTQQLQKTIEVFENNIPVFPYEVCFGLFRHVIDSNSSTNCLAMLPFFQAVINLGFANQPMMEEILLFLVRTRGMPKFTGAQVQLRIQQLLILLISRTSVRFDNLTFVHRLINMLFSLDNSRNLYIRRNSVSSLLQIVILLINEAKDTQKHQEQLVKLLKQFILLSDNVRPEWYAAELQPDRELATHLLAQLMQQPYFRQELAKYEKLLISLMAITTKNLYSLNKQVLQPQIPLSRRDSIQLQQQLCINLLFFMLYVRTLVRCSKLLLREFEFLQSLMKQLTNKECFPFKAVAHESITFLFNDYRWVNGLLESSHQELLVLLLQSELNEVRAICSDERLDMNVAVEQPPQLKQLMQSNDTEVQFPQYSHGLQLKLIVKDIEQVTFSIYSIYQQCYKIPLDQKYLGQMPLAKIFGTSQKIIYQTVKVLLPRDMPQSLLQSLLKIIEKFINISGCFGDYKVCGMWIKLICRHCLPTEFRLIDYRHVQINKMVLNTANCLGELLDVSAWIIIWKALENYESYYNKYLLSREVSQYLHERQNDVQILYQSLDSIFTESTKYSLQYLLTIIDSLVQVTYECLENNFSDEGKKIFSFERIGQVYRINLHRLCSIWPSLSSSLLCITTSKVSYFRISALALLNQLIPITLSYLHTNQQSLSGKFTPDNYQRLIFEPWLNLVKCKFPELKEQIILALNKVVIDYGHVLSHGWSCLLEIIKEIGDFKSMQVIIDTFLEQVDDYMEAVVEIVQQFKASLTDPNQKYLCLTFLWTIGDHTHRQNKLPLLQKIFALLLQPEYPFVFNPQARHSAFYIFTQLLIHNCSNQTYQFWQRIFASIEIYVKYVVGELKKTTQPKIVEEAGKNILLNLIKIYKKYFPILSRCQKEQEHQLGFFYNFNVEVLKLGNTDLYVLSLKQIREMLTVKLQESLQLAQFKRFLVSLTQMYVVSTDLKLMKCLVSYMPPDIFEVLQRCLTDLPSIFHETYRLMERIFLLRLEAEEKDVKLQNARIYFQEKLILELIKNFVKTVRSVEVRQRPTQTSPLKGKELSDIVLREDSSRTRLPFLQLFCSNFLMTLQKLLLYEDYHYIGKLVAIAIELVGELLTQGQIELSDKYLAYLQKLMLTKYSLPLLKKQAKGKDIPLWHYCTQELIKLCSEWIRVGQLQQSLKLQRLFREYLAYPQEAPETIVKNTTLESLGLYHENELFLLNYTLEQFVISSKFPTVPISQVEALADMISKRSHSEDSESNVVSYTRMNLELLFKLCQRKSSDGLSQEDNRLLLQRSSRFLLRLIQRVTAIFQTFFATEKKYGSLPVNQNTVSEVVLVLGRLDKLHLMDGILEYLSEAECLKLGLNWTILQRSHSNKLLRGQSALLVYFHRTLTNCIRSKEQEVRDRVCVLFEKLDEMMLAV